MNQRERFTGAMLGLAYGDAISVPALFHRFQMMPRRRHGFLWRTNQSQDEMNISRLTMPFTHRDLAEKLEPAPTDDTEFALLTLRALLAESGEVTQQTFTAIWQLDVVPNSENVRSSISERAAIENFRHGLLPPHTGSDNPLHFEDSAVVRAVPVGLFYAGDPARAAHLAEWDASVTQAEDGVYAARAMAAAIALLANGASIAEATARARQELPEGSWIAYGDSIAQACRDESDSPETLALLLGQRLINTVYSYGNAAPETLPAALVIVEACEGDLYRAANLANTIAKCSDSLPAMVGALCGAYQGEGVIGAQWLSVLTTARGYCLPFLAGVNIVEAVEQLYDRLAVGGV